MLELTAADGRSKWMYMGDRWCDLLSQLLVYASNPFCAEAQRVLCRLNPDNAHAAYVWLPALFTDLHTLDIQFHATWDLDKYLNSDFYENNY